MIPGIAFDSYINRNISIAKMGKPKNITNKTYAKIGMSQLQNHHRYGNLMFFSDRAS